MNKTLLAFGILLAARYVGAEPQSHFASLDDGLKVHYSVYGEGEPTLVFVHGWASDETVWNGQAPELGGEMRCITVDLPGHGQSDKPDIQYTMHLYARALDAVLRDAKVPSAVLVGHSNGVPTVRQFYREYPASVRGLVMVDGGLRAFVDPAGMEKFIAPFRTNYQEQTSKFLAFLTKPMKTDAERAEIKAIIMRTPQQVAISELENTADPALWKPDKIDVPVLMILAKQPVWTPEYEQFAHSLVPKLDYQVWENVSHFIMMDEPKKFNDAVRTWLKNNALREHA